MSLENFLHLISLENAVVLCYLGILLTLTGREKKSMRSLDVIEGAVREASGGQWFYVDQCIDSFRLRTICMKGQEYTAERQFCYEW